MGMKFPNEDRVLQQFLENPGKQYTASDLREYLMVPRGERLLSGKAISAAVEELGAAKALHDKLEAVYRPYMDFDALTRFTEKYVEGLCLPPEGSQNASMA